MALRSRAVASTALAPVAGQLPDGVYLNLPEETYFAQKGRRGSTDWSSLYTRREGWWWKSEHNPDRVEESEEARTFGKALHALVLEGDRAYAQRFAVSPDPDVEATKRPEFCRTVKDIVEAFERRQMHPKANIKKEELIALAQTRAPDLYRNIWDVIWKDWQRANVGKLPISEVEHRQLQIMADAVRTHPDIGELFQFGDDHIPLSEVSILWHDEHGIPRRARLDEMLPLSTVDVKTMGNVGQRPLKFAAGEHVAQNAYHVQLADHHIARKVAYRFIIEGKVYDGSLHDAKLRAEGSPEEIEAAADKFKRELAWLKRFPSEAPNWDYAWLFYQKPDAKRGMAPVVFPWAEDYGGDVHLRGIRCRREAIQLYRQAMAQFGPDTPWTRVEPVHTTVETATSRVYLPHWIGGDEPVAGEEEDL